MPAETLFLVQMSLLLVAIGAVGGFLSGLLGVGGGILFVPALSFCLAALHLDDTHAMHIAVGSSLAIICATGAVAAFSHYRRGSVDMAHIRLWTPFLLGGVVAGSVLAAFVASDVLRTVFAAVTFFLCLHMLFSSQLKSPSACRIIPRRVQRAVMAMIGALSALIGVGGAVMTVPFMLLMGFPMPRAAGTGAALGMAIALPGTVFYMATGSFYQNDLPPYSFGFVNLLAVGIIIPASVLAAPFGVQASYSLPRDMLRRVFAVVLLLVSLRMFLTL